MPIKTDKDSALRYGRALYDIQALMSGVEWTSDTFSDVWKVMMNAGFHIYDSNESPRWASTSSGRIEIQMSLEEAQSASHQGQCDDDVLALSREPHIAAQLAEIDPALLVRELREYGAWDDNELKDHDQNLQRLLWSMAGDIVENERDENRDVG
jgi:hypothetical protein